MPREYHLDFELEGTEYDDAVVDVAKSLCFWTQHPRTNLGQNRTLTRICGRYACR